MEKNSEKTSASKIETALLDVRLEKIRVTRRLRDVDQGEVEKIALSMSEQGQITPIELRATPDADGFYVLIAGAHRVAAAEKNGDETIRAILFDGSADEERLREIDENLYRHELTPYDQANFLEERRQIWERLNGKGRRGGDRRSKRQVGATEKRNDLKSFYNEVGDLFSLPKRTVQRALERRRCIIPEIWEALRGKAEAKNGALLDKLADVAIEDQPTILKIVQERGASFSGALATLKVPTETKPPSVVQIMKKVVAAWEEWDAQERAIFLREVRKLK